MNIEYPNSKNELWRFADIKSFSKNNVDTYLSRAKVEQKDASILDFYAFDKELCLSLSLSKEGLLGAGDLDVSEAKFNGELGTKIESLVVENAKKSILKLNSSSPKILIEVDSSFGFSPSLLQIDIQEAASAQIFVVQDSASNAFVDSLLELNLMENSSLKITFINNTNEDSLLYSKAKFKLGKSSKLELFSMQEGLSASRVEYSFDIEGEYANVDATCFIKNSAKCLHNLNTYQLHKVPNASSNLKLRNVLSNGAKATFAGFVKIEKDAQCTSAMQSCKTLLLDKTSRISALPILEIEANDVECSHGCAVSMPDEEQVFYLQARGLTQEQAKDLIAKGFVNFENALS